MATRSFAGSATRPNGGLTCARYGPLTPVRPVRKGRPRVREFSREVIDFKIRFEAETGVRLPMAGRHDSSGRVRPGWVTSLRAFHRIAFFDGEENAVLGGL